ncbi:elongation of very long chain fatty acids protein 7-like [Thrips palmi]|uniref:Elongation of very long chain fatty acids protein n=1 Tax=Thrips palmi TaxID=161013 RepID=A0A6P8YYP1_THRPL|nr:elongation of very long chain fatty acids protein 7-like [Thrips palmi]XP_034242387.1 elongation of very long chain fatty acids protein 7-like [Thrips palmi]
MAALISSAVKYYDFLFYELADPRTNSMPLIGNPFYGLAIIGFYLYFVLNLGPRLMKNREPFQLKPLLTVFDIFQIVSSLIIFYKCLTLGWGPGGHYKLICQPIDFSDDPHAVEIAWYVWFYMMLKFIDLLDTVFIVLRKNQRQVTFLHVYHHTGVAMMLWGAAKYFPGGHGTLLGLINSFVHAIMYSYYLLTTVAPDYKKNIWWKVYITRMQLVQFVILGLHAVSVLLYPNCEYQCKYVYSAIMVPQNFFMFMLFYNFYRKAYGGKRKAS